MYVHWMLLSNKSIGYQVLCNSTHKHAHTHTHTHTEATTDDIELRICADQVISNEDSPIEVVELYIR